MDKKRAYCFYGGWDGHEPEKVSARFQRMLENEGYEFVRENTLEHLEDQEFLETFDLIIPLWTQGHLDDKYCFHLTDAVANGVGLAGKGPPRPSCHPGRSAFCHPERSRGIRQRRDGQKVLPAGLGPGGVAIPVGAVAFVRPLGRAAAGCAVAARVHGEALHREHVAAEMVETGRYGLREGLYQRK